MQDDRKIYLDEPIIIKGIKIHHTQHGLQHLIDHYTHLLQNPPSDKVRSKEVTAHMQLLVENWKQHLQLMKTNLIEQIAQVAHEVNKAFCESIGDHSQPEWDDAPEWQKQSAISGVSFHLSWPDAKLSDSHSNWMKQKEADGWKYGPVKNPETKEHPCILPYDQLPVEQRSKDFLFKQIVHSVFTQMDRLTR
jgi:hypothetical protein